MSESVFKGFFLPKFRAGNLHNEVFGEIKDP